MINIRVARTNEVKILQDLNNEVFIDNHKYEPDLNMDWAKSKFGKKYFTQLIKDQEKLCLIAEDDQKAIGYLAAGPKEASYLMSKYIEVENMGVIPEYRSHGVGSQLIQKCIELAKNKGYQKIYVSAYFTNTEGVKFYKKNGFLEIDLALQRDI